jgi:hypothetical protein
MALGDCDSGELLESLAASERDTVVAKSFRAVAIRLRGPQAVVDLFVDPGVDPQLARLLVSNYNSRLRLEVGDVRFLVTALRHYIDRSLPWLPKLRPDLWGNGVFLILDALSNESAVRLLRADELEAELSQLLRSLAALVEHTDDDDILSDAINLRAVLS